MKGLGKCAVGDALLYDATYGVSLRSMVIPWWQKSRNRPWLVLLEEGVKASGSLGGILQPRAGYRSCRIGSLTHT